MVWLDEKNLAGSLAAVVAALLALCLLPAPARADWQDFLPTPFRNSLTLDAGGIYERRETGSGEQAQARAETDLYFKERLTFVTNGFSYHPRFIQYHLMVAADLKQETYKNDTLGTVSSNGAGFDYDLRLNILPEHPYRLTLFTSRMEPIYREYYSMDSGTVEIKRGAMFNYRKKPFFLNLRYTETTHERAQGASKLETYGINGMYFKDFGAGRKFSLSSFYDHSTTRPSSGPAGNVQNYGAANTIDMNASSLQSTISGTVYRQDAERGSAESSGLTWLERLHLQLPLNLSSIVNYRYQKHEQSFTAAGAPDAQVRSAANRDFEFNLIHMLYKSLETTYRLTRDVSTSDTGETTSTSNFLGVNYSKSVPRGMLLAGGNVSRADTNSAGRATVASEAHDHLGLNQVFTTLQREADCGSIAVFLTDHAVGDRPVQVEFVAVPSPGARCDILVTGIPPEFDETVPHDYTISYVLETGNSTIRTDSYSYNASLTLFRNNLNPYYSRTVSKSAVVSGSYPGTPFDGAVSIAGVILGGLPLRLTVEHEQNDGISNSYRRWRGQLDYNQSVTTTTYVAFTAAYISTAYPEGATASSPQGYTDKETRLSANLQQRLFARNLTLSAGGSYSLYRGLMESSAYTLQASLQWKIGKTTITGGANGYRSRWDGQPDTYSVRSRQYYYLNVRRELF